MRIATKSLEGRRRQRRRWWDHPRRGIGGITPMKCNCPCPYCISTPADAENDILRVTCSGWENDDTDSCKVEYWNTPRDFTYSSGPNTGPNGCDSWSFVHSLAPFNDIANWVIGVTEFDPDPDAGGCGPTSEHGCGMVFQTSGELYYFEADSDNNMVHCFTQFPGVCGSGLVVGTIDSFVWL